MKRFLLSIAILFAVSVSVRAQDAEQATEKRKKATSGELFETIARIDAAAFDAFNAHDIEQLMATFTDAESTRGSSRAGAPRQRAREDDEGVASDVARAELKQSQDRQHPEWLLEIRELTPMGNDLCWQCTVGLGTSRPNEAVAPTDNPDLLLPRCPRHASRRHHDHD